MPCCIAFLSAQGGLGWLTSWEGGAPQLGWADTGAYLVLPILLIVSQVSGSIASVASWCFSPILRIAGLAVTQRGSACCGQGPFQSVMQHVQLSYFVHNSSAQQPLVLSSFLLRLSSPACSTSRKRSSPRPRATTRRSSRRPPSSSSCP